jgi:hypothetical protein
VQNISISSTLCIDSFHTFQQFLLMYRRCAWHCDIMEVIGLLSEKLTCIWSLSFFPGNDLNRSRWYQLFVINSSRTSYVTFSKLCTVVMDTHCRCAYDFLEFLPSALVFYLHQLRIVSIIDKFKPIRSILESIFYVHVIFLFTKWLDSAAGETNFSYLPDC